MTTELQNDIANIQLFIAERKNFDALLAKYVAQQTAINKLITDFTSEGLGEDKSSKEWDAAFPGCDQASYRAGCANTITMVVEKLKELAST